jgi:rubrerythrin
MDIYDFAMKMEKDGEAYYRELAGKTVNKGLRSILNMLADAELQHYRLFHGMKENSPVGAAETPILEEVKNLFVRLKGTEGSQGVDSSAVDLYRRAQAIEEESRDFYRSKAGEAGDENRREVFLKIAEEEQKHYLILENIIDFVSRPEQWLEDAEWYHLDEY